MSQVMGLLLLLALGGLQLGHFGWLYLNQDWVLTVPYRIMLFTVAPAFYLFSLPLLRPQAASTPQRSMLWHVLPILFTPFLAPDIALPLAFVLGAGYLLWLARSLYQLRLERNRFRLEMLLLGAVFTIALCVSLLGLMQTALPDKLFYSLYGAAIGLAFFLVQITLDLRPNLSVDISETVQAAYASSTLTNVDCETTLAMLDHLMRVDQIYVDGDLSLPALAQHLALSSHQLSELMNTRLGKSFSRYLREQRIAAARAMLRNQPSASVLSVGLSVGFTAQSNFYEAFREIEGMTPGQYRKLSLAAG